MSENQHTCTSWRLAYENERKRADRLYEECQVLRLHLRARQVDVAMVELSRGNSDSERRLHNVALLREVIK